MLNGKISKLASVYSKKKLLYLLLLWVTLLVSISIIVILFVVQANELVISIVAFFLILLVFFMIFYAKTKVSYYDMLHRYQLLLERSTGVEKVNCKFDNDWLLELERNEYSLYLDKLNYTIYYRIRKSISKKTFIKARVIEIITIIKNNDLDLFSNDIESEYKKLWLKYEKEYHLNKQVIIQFVKYKTFSDSIKTNLDRIISYRDGDNFLIHINCGYFTDSQSIYYLHSDLYYPNAYYKYAVDSIKKITN